MTETYRGAVHFATGCLASAMCLYNAGEAFGDRAERRHAINALLYLGLVGWEFLNVRHHLRNT